MNRAQRRAKAAQVQKATGMSPDELLAYAGQRMERDRKEIARLRMLLTEAGDLLGSDLTYILSMDKVGIPAAGVRPYYMEAAAPAAGLGDFNRVNPV